MNLSHNNSDPVLYKIKYLGFIPMTIDHFIRSINILLFYFFKDSFS